MNDKCNQLQVTPDNLNLLAREVKKSLSYREFEANIPRSKEKKKTNGWGGIAILINNIVFRDGLPVNLNWSVWNVSDLSTQFYFPDMRL